MHRMPGNLDLVGLAVHGAKKAVDKAVKGLGCMGEGGA